MRRVGARGNSPLAMHSRASARSSRSCSACDMPAIVCAARGGRPSAKWLDARGRRLTGVSAVGFFSGCVHLWCCAARCSDARLRQFHVGCALTKPQNRAGGASDSQSHADSTLRVAFACRLAMTQPREIACLSRLRAVHSTDLVSAGLLLTVLGWRWIFLPRGSLTCLATNDMLP